MCLLKFEVLADEEGEARRGSWVHDVFASETTVTVGNGG